MDEVWRWFTERPCECYDFGLLLVKETRRRESEDANVSLASVGAKLSDLMPAGSERFVRSSAYRGEAPRVLVLSGGYPQPGWGVLVEWRRDINAFEDLIRRVTVRLRDRESTNELDVFREATESFHRLRALRTPPANEKASVLAVEIRAGESVETCMREAQNALQAGERRFVGEKIIAAMQAMRQAVWLDTPEGVLQSLLDAQRTMVTAASVSGVSREFLATEIEPILAPLVADPSQREAAFDRLSSDAQRLALKACLHLRGKGIVGEAESFHGWAERILVEVPGTLATGLARLSKNIDAKLVARRGEKAQLEHEHDLAMAQWRQTSSQARESFHRAAGRAVELQWELGPHFLVDFEQLCQQDGLWVKSIPWDPARMVGWKIMAGHVRLDCRDLQIAAEELVPGATGANAANGPTAAIADGSYFTDYVHHIAISKPGISPRAVTRDLVARLLRPGEMITLIQAHRGDPPSATDAPHLAEELLNAFGWQQSDEVREKPLAGCIRIGGATPATLAENLSGNDLRIVLESFCKDIVDVVVAQLGYSHAGVWSAIDERVPTYRPSSRTKDWEEEVRLLTTGGAVMLLPALAPLAFPARASEVAEFARDLRKLSEALNQRSHHREGETDSSKPLDEAPALIRQLLAKAEAFLGELPWHLDASFVYGDQPKVLSGEAWSHGSPTPRLLRVIVWTGTSPGSHVTLWNKTRRNPIVTDPVFIVRPRRR